MPAPRFEVYKLNVPFISPFLGVYAPPESSALERIT